MIKSIFTAILVGGFVSQIACGQAGASASKSKGVDASVLAPQVVERGPDHRVWETYRAETNSENKIVVYTNSYKEIASGLHYKENAKGEWKETVEQFDLKPGKAVAKKGRHAVSIGNNIHAAGSVEITMPDGRVLRTHPLALSYVDTASGKSTIIAEVKDSQGVVVAPNQILFADAFDGVSADIRYTYSKGAVEQDVLLRESPPGPEEWNLPQTSRLEMLTEFLDGPQPKIQHVEKIAKKQGSKVSSGTSALATNKTTVEDGDDDDLDWSGAMHMGHGKAFLSGDDKKSTNSVSVKKSYIDVQGRKILVEAVPWNAVSKELNKLPKPHASLKAGQGKVQRVASVKPVLPKQPLAQVSNKQMQVAAITSDQKGYVLDYMLQISDYSGDYLFQGDTTYFVSGPVYLQNVTLEGGAILKFCNDGSGCLNGGSITCNTAPYRPKAESGCVCRFSADGKRLLGFF